jgi:hypothetical protein
MAAEICEELEKHAIVAGFAAEKRMRFLEVETSAEAGV